MLNRVKFSLFLAGLYLVAVHLIPVLHVVGILCPHSHHSSRLAPILCSGDAGHDDELPHQHIHPSLSSCSHFKIGTDAHNDKADHALSKSGHVSCSDLCPICQFIASFAAEKNTELKTCVKYSSSIKLNIELISFLRSKKINPANPPTGPPLA